jgi:hypothetical protein
MCRNILSRHFDNKKAQDDYVGFPNRHDTAGDRVVRGADTEFLLYESIRG